MPLTDTYQKFDRDGLFGIIANVESPIQFVQNIPNSSVVAVACASYLVFWNLKTSEIESFYSRPNCTELVTAFYVSNNYVAVGFNDGFVDVYKRDSTEVESQFRAGRHKINHLLIDEDILFCASGSEINVCDLVSDTGYKLKGHKGYITRMRLILDSTILVTSGQDSLIKFWSLKNHHCFMTITGHPGQVWDFDISKDFSYLISGCADPYLRLWSLHFHENSFKFLASKESFDSLKTETIEDLSDVDYNSILSVKFLGTIDRDSKKRVYALSFDTTSNFIFCQTLESSLSIYQLANEQTIKKRQSKKRKKMKEEEDAELIASDYVKYVYKIDLPCKLASFSALTKIGKQDKLEIIFALHLANNILQQIRISPLSLAVPHGPTKEINLDVENESQVISATTLFKLFNPGHRKPAFSCHLTDESLGILTVSQSEAKFWSRLNQSCYLTITWEDEHLTASAAILAPGGRFAVIGYEDGSIRVYELYSKSLEFNLPEAHAGPVRALALSGDKKAVYSGSSDKTMKCWDFDFQRTNEKRMCLGLKSAVERKVPDSVTCLVITPNNQLICVAMVNLHVDVHFRDTFRRAHSLYGHVAPVTAMDVSQDSRQLITSSTDKTVRLWELQFGNMVRRFTAHHAPVTSVCMLPTSPNSYSRFAFSGDAEGVIKQWDLKKLQEVTTLRGPSSGVDCISSICKVTPEMLARQQERQQQKGQMKTSNRQKSQHDSDSDSATDMHDEDNEDLQDIDFLTGGIMVAVCKDWSIRVWSESSEDLIVLQDEQETEREKEHEDNEILRTEIIIPGTVATETEVLGRPTATTLEGVDLLMQAIDLYEEYSLLLKKRQNDGKEFVPHPLMESMKCGRDPEKFLLLTLKNLRQNNRGIMTSNSFEHLLACLHSSYTLKLVPHLINWLSAGTEVEVCARAFRLLIDMNYCLISQDENCRQIFISDKINKTVESVTKMKQQIATNLVGLNFVRCSCEKQKSILMFDEALAEKNKRKKKAATLV